MLLKVLEIRNDNLTMTNYEIGQKANIELDLLARTTDGDLIDESLERRRMTIAVSRYLAQAKNLIANAEQGVFPSIKTPAKH
jgi:riboflavin synthase alpha subunit